MANWVDFLSLITTLSVICGIAYGVYYIAMQGRAALESTKQSLKSKGVNVSEHGISVKTSRRLDREGYMDATQRSVIKALQNSQFGPSSDTLHVPGPDRATARPVLSRHSSTHSVSGVDRK